MMLYDGVPAQENKEIQEEEISCWVFTQLRAPAVGSKAHTDLGSAHCRTDLGSRRPCLCSHVR